MDKRSLSDDQLIQNFSGMIVLERKHGVEIIEYIHEIDRRRLYLKYKFTSLFQYLTEVFGYTLGSAQRRIDAARLLGDVPEIKENIRDGKLNLMQVSTLARSVREKQKLAPVLPEQKREILNAIKSQDISSSEKTICQMLDLKPKLQEKKRTQKDESVRLELTFTKEQMAVVEQAKSAISHTHPNPTMAELVVHMAHELLKKKGLAESSTAKMAVKKSLNRAYVSHSVRRQVFKEEKCCQWRNKHTGKICGSRFQVQIDHKQPLWADGSSERENLQLLCAIHNRMKYGREAGIRT